MFRDERFELLHKEIQVLIKDIEALQLELLRLNSKINDSNKITKMSLNSMYEMMEAKTKFEELLKTVEKINPSKNVN